MSDTAAEWGKGHPFRVIYFFFFHFLFFPLTGKESALIPLSKETERAEKNTGGRLVNLNDDNRGQMILSLNRFPSNTPSAGNLIAALP